MEENFLAAVLRENEQLKLTIKELRQQLEKYRKKSYRQYETDKDHLPYHEYERE